MVIGMEGQPVDIFEAMSTTRSIRRFKPDPIPEADLERIMQATLWAPSGGNRQTWRFIAVQDAEQKAKIGAVYNVSTRALYESGYLDPPPGATPEEAEGYHKRRRGGEEFAATIHLAPVIVIACIERPADGSPIPFTAGGSIYPAVQNLMLAARALGIGSVITTNHIRSHDREARDILGIPDSYQVAALVPLGYPRGNFGPLKRNPVGEVWFRDRWGT